jgi:hypothetical protein
MLSPELAVRLRAAGVRWTPTPGDAFVVPGLHLDDRVFVLSDMVVELKDVPGGSRVLAFNGTTEWALDSLEVDRAVWVPREDQLRGLLGGAFVALERQPGPPVSYVVTLEVGRHRSRHVDVTPEETYARALLALLADVAG